MRTTVTVDDDVAAQLERSHARRDRPFERLEWFSPLQS